MMRRALNRDTLPEMESSLRLYTYQLVKMWSSAARSVRFHTLKQFRFHKPSHSSCSLVSQKGLKCEAIAVLQCAGSGRSMSMLARRVALTFELLTIASHTLLQDVSRQGRVCGVKGCNGSTCLKNAKGVCACFSMRLMVCRVTKLYLVFDSGTTSVLPGCVECFKVREVCLLANPDMGQSLRVSKYGIEVIANSVRVFSTRGVTRPDWHSLRCVGCVGVLKIPRRQLKHILMMQKGPT